MPLETLENGKSFLEQRTKINATIDEVNSITDGTSSGDIPVTATGTTTPRTLGNWTEKEILSYNSIADAKADTKLDIGRRVKTYGYYSVGDGGCAEYVVVVGGTGTADDGSFHDAVNGNQLKLLGKDGFNIRVFGVKLDGVTNDAVAVANASEYAYQNGFKFIEVDDDCFVDGDVKRKANVIFIGEGQFVRTVNWDFRKIGIYRRQVIPKNAPPAKAYPDNIQKIKVKDPSAATVVFFGDSLTTYSANSSSSGNTKSAHFENMIRSSNPNTAFTFYNRAIGGKGSREMNTKPDSVPSTTLWYTDVNRDWLEYIYDLSPDIVVMATGMNENLNFDQQDIYDIKTKIEANTDAQIVFVADYLPTISPVGIREDISFAWYIAQEWRDRAAGFIRSYANLINYPLIDLNRTFSMIRDGFDVLSPRFIKQRDEDFDLVDGRLVTYSTGAVRSFSIRATFVAGCFTNPDPVTVYVDTTSKHYVWLREDSGFIKLEFRSSGGTPTGFPRIITTTLPVPVSDNEYEIVVTPTSFSIRDVTNGKDYARYTTPMIKFGGLFGPAINYFAQTTGPIVSIEGYYAGRESLVMPTVTDQEYFGVVESGFENTETGGDGQVHPSAMGLEALNNNHYSMQNFELINRDNNTLTLTTSEAGTIEAYYRKKSDGSYIIKGSAQTNASGVLTISLPITASDNLSKLSTVSARGLGGVSPFILVMDSNASNTTDLTVLSYDTSGVASGNELFTFTIMDNG
jgi:hypothetical protein